MTVTTRKPLWDRLMGWLTVDRADDPPVAPVAPVLPEPLRVVYITTKDDRTFKGILVHQGADGVLLRAASVSSLDPINGQMVQWTKMTGDLVVPMDNVSYWQEGLDPSALE